VPGAFNPLSAMLIERHGFDGYISGAVISADLGLPDVGLTTLTEVAGRHCCRVRDFPDPVR
jgi:methylisocitrate lyase